MSRTGKQPIPIPEGVKTEINGSQVKVVGSRGELGRGIPPGIKVEIAKGKILVKRTAEDSVTRSLHGLSRALLANMVRGVSQGFEKTLEIVGTGYRAKLEGENLVLQIGFSHPVKYKIPVGIKIELPRPTRIVVNGVDKQLVGEIASQIRRVYPPEPYKGKGIRYLGEKVRHKVGKAAIKTGFAAPA